MSIVREVHRIDRDPDGVSAQTIYNWAAGKSRLRAQQLKGITTLRTMESDNSPRAHRGTKRANRTHTFGEYRHFCSICTKQRFEAYSIANHPLNPDPAHIAIHSLPASSALFNAPVHAGSVGFFR
jgi:hypothetical protein